MPVFTLIFIALLTCASSFMSMTRWGAPRRAGLELSMSSEEPLARTFASYVIYKGKGAASVKSIPPVFSQIPGTRSRNVKQQGGLLFEVAPCVGTREYDWTKKSTFLLDPTECGEIVSMEKQVGCDFFHDPFMSDPNKAGLITKKMSWKPSQDGRGMFLSLTVTEKGSKDNYSSISIPVTWAELEVMQSILRYSIPHYLGFHEVWNNGGLGMVADAPPNPSGPTEWNNFSDEMK